MEFPSTAANEPRMRPSPTPNHRMAKQALRLEVSWAESEEEIRAAQRLRYLVFASEMGACLDVPPGTPAGHDADRFDDFCAHLLVRAHSSRGEPGEVVGTYRVLTPDAARRAGGFYSETEFDMARLASMRPRMLELGRSCIAPRFRTGGTILLLWSAIGEFMYREGLDVTFGCASVDGGDRAIKLWHQLSASRLAPPERRVTPLRPFDIRKTDGDARVEVPALIKGYLRCGSEVLGPPAWDPDFNAADFPMLMMLSQLPQRHRRHFLRGETKVNPNVQSDWMS